MEEIIRKNIKYIINNIQEKYNPNFNPKKGIQFEFILPFQVPYNFNHGINHINLEHNVKQSLSLFFERIAYNSENKQAGVIYRSKVHAVLLRNNSNNTSTIASDKLSDDFNDCLKELNKTILSYSCASKDFSVYPISVQAILPMVVYRLIEIANWKTSTAGILALDLTKIEYEKNLLNPDDPIAVEANRYETIFKNNLNPYEAPIRLINSSRELLDTGRLSLAVIIAQTAVETFINATIKIIKTDLNENEDKITNIIEETPFKNKLEDHFLKPLGIDTDTSEYKQWESNTYKTRGEIIHQGIFIDLPTARNGVKSAYEFITNVANTFPKHKNKYPTLENLFIVKWSSKKQ